MRPISSLAAMAVVLNIALLATAVSMGVPMLVRVREQLATGHVPALYAMREFAVVVASPFGVAGLIGLGLALWPLGRRWWLVLADAIAVAAAWTAFAPFVFVNAAPLVAMPLSVIALIMTLVTLHRRRRQRHARSAVASSSR